MLDTDLGMEILKSIQSLQGKKGVAIQQATKRIFDTCWKAFQGSKPASVCLEALWHHYSVAMPKHWECRAGVVWFANYCASQDTSAIQFLLTYAANDTDYRVQACLTKAIESYLNSIDYSGARTELQNHLRYANDNARCMVMSCIKKRPKNNLTFTKGEANTFNNKNLVPCR